MLEKPITPLVEECHEFLAAEKKCGRCVFACDNDVVDHQETNILFENGVTANLCMTAFTKDGGRIYKFHGTMGEVVIDEQQKFLALRPYGKENKVIPFAELNVSGSGHGGGDQSLINEI